jgi:hypothetical protein
VVHHCSNSFEYFVTIGLDLTVAKAKVARAREHLDLLNTELTATLREKGAYSFRFSEVDPDSGWCSMFLSPSALPEPRFGILLGDFIHNLRSALDYIVTELVQASNARLTMSHQFPIFVDEAGYIAAIGTPQAPKASGPLGGVIYGRELIESLQPYKRRPEPRADQLWCVYRFSNTDKHRYIATRIVVPLGPAVDISYNGTLVEKVDIEEISDWSPDTEHEVARLRFDPPYARNLRAHGTMPVAVLFSTDPFGSGPDAVAAHVMALSETCDYISTILDLFELL